MVAVPLMFLLEAKRATALVAALIHSSSPRAGVKSSV